MLTSAARRFAGDSFGNDAAKLKENVEREAATRLGQSSYPELRGVRSDFREGVLQLRGQVSTYYLKQMAQNLVHQLDGVTEIDNRLDVLPPPIDRGLAFTGDFEGQHPGVIILTMRSA